ncbi:hypothetical protein HY214_01345 [Candidatus Roizmanbacteria bacterium]|nr:hypothetical protein [Candidatus Roizmanbacteria bacterium]
MIKRIFVSETDRNNLSKFKTVELPKVDKSSYRDIVVCKPWGYEYLMFENDYVAIWILHLKKGHETSMHCHPRKKSSLVVISGKVLTSTLTEWFEFGHLQGIIYDAGVFHSTKALSEETFVMEIETPPMKKDLVRLKDSYGRETQGYEGRDKHSRDVHKFNYIFFDKKDVKSQTDKKINNTVVSINKCRTNFLDHEFSQRAKLKEKSIYCIIEEKVIDLEHRSYFWAGAIFDADGMKNRKNIRLFNNCLLLSVRLAKDEKAS